jgi:hypothetical protein
MRLASADHPASSGSLLGDQRWVFQLLLISAAPLSASLKTTQIGMSRCVESADA